MNINDYDWERLSGLGFAEKTAGDLKDACWKGYQAVGMKTKNGKKVPNCVPKTKKKEYSEDPEKSQMTPNYLPKEPGFSEHEDFSSPLESMEPNARMAINQLRVMREKIDIMLGILYPDDNLEPWMATKLTMSAQNLSSVADYIRFGVEFSEAE